VVGLRGYAQRDPLNEYKTEGFTLFETMLSKLRETVTGQLMRVEIAERQAPTIEATPLPAMTARHIDPLTGRNDMEDAELAFAQSGAAAVQGTKGQPSDPNNPASWGKVQRNAPCPCGSGKKYKHCHGRYA
jgi:preprotein translocase subunit SecA